MIIFWQRSWKWLCWVGLHEYASPWKDIKKKPTVWTCDLCGKVKRARK
jgi:hypothetical protein